MDAPNTSHHNLNDIFTNEGDWIVTNNVGSDIKIARCGEESGIFEKEREWYITKSNNENSLPYLPTSERYKTARFFIRDLLMAAKLDICFMCKDIKFVSVYIFGTIISLYPHKNKFCVVVDDGTSSIICFLGDSEYVEDLKQENCIEVKDLTNMCKNDNQNNLLKAALTVASCTKLLLASSPCYKDLQVGDSVQLIGNIREFNGNRYIFVTKIKKHSEESTYNITYLEELLHLYEHVYI